jgi:mRNA interferase HigB
VKAVYAAADQAGPYTIFDIGGNKWRLITAIHYKRKKVYIRYVFTHAQYDRWKAG